MSRLEHLRKATVPAAALGVVLVAAALDAYVFNGYHVDQGQEFVKEQNPNYVAPVAKAKAVPVEVPVVFLDPGHGGTTDESRIDSATGLGDRYNPNGTEQIEDWKVAKIAESQLQAAGYIVHLSKESADQGMFLRDRVTKAIEKGADLAVSIHTDGGQPFSWGRIFEQKVGGCRGTEPNKVCFTNAKTADMSHTYAITMQQTRTAAEGRPVEITVNSFDGRAPIEPGDLPIVQLLSENIPWVYHEIGADDGLDEAEQQMYATGIVNGIKAALPIVRPTTTS